MGPTISMIVSSDIAWMLSSMRFLSLKTTRDAELGSSHCFQQSEQAGEQFLRPRRTAADVQVHRNYLLHSANDGVAVGENPPIERAVADRNNPLRIRRRAVG